MIACFDMGQHTLVPRRRVLGLVVGFLLAPGRGKGWAGEASRFGCELDLGLLFGLVTVAARGDVRLEVDRPGGWYLVAIAIEGDGVSGKSEMRGLIRDGRFVPEETRSVTTFRGRESRLSIRFDHDRRLIDYHALGYTLVLGRRRQADDQLRMPADRPVDDLISTCLNFTAGRLDQAPDGTYSTLIVRRARNPREGPEDVASGPYRAEIIPLSFRTIPDPSRGGVTALVDTSRYSSWAKPGALTRVRFGPGRRLESVESPLALGSSLAFRLTPNVAGDRQV
jgi:hypothetical protein